MDYGYLDTGYSRIKIIRKYFTYFLICIESSFHIELIQKQSIYVVTNKIAMQNNIGYAYSALLLSQEIVD